MPLRSLLVGVIRVQDLLISFQNVTHVYGQGTASMWKALDNVSLDVYQGEFVAVLGHNGSGKSTLAKHANALLLPSQGTVMVNGMDTQDEDKVWDIRQQVGMVFQNPDNQLVATTVEEDVAFGPENLGVPTEEIHRRVTQALETVGMLGYRYQSPHQLSGGQKQRVAIAGMIAMLPQCIVLDEPTAMLDPVGRLEVMQTIQQLNKEQGITIMHITHYMDEAILADRVVVMEAGKIALSGTPREVFSKVDLLYKLQLDVPQVTALAGRLKKQGFEVPEDILTVDEMVKYLCR